MTWIRKKKTEPDLSKYRSTRMLQIPKFIVRDSRHKEFCWPTSSTTWITNLYARIACCSTDKRQHQTLRIHFECHYLLFRRGLRANKKKLEYIANQNVNLLPAREDVLNNLKIIWMRILKILVVTSSDQLWNSKITLVASAAKSCDFWCLLKWIGFQHRLRSFRKVLHFRPKFGGMWWYMSRQCRMNHNRNKWSPNESCHIECQGWPKSRGDVFICRIVVGTLMKRKTLFVNIARNVERSVMRVVSLSLFLEASMRSGWYLTFLSRLQDGFLNESSEQKMWSIYSD